MESPSDDERDGWIEIHDLDALVESDDKIRECRYFLSLIERERNWNRFRWLTSSFMGAGYSFFEIQALGAFFSLYHPQTGDPIQNDEALTVLRRYVSVLQDAKRPSYVKTKGVHRITEVLYNLRRGNTHHYPLTIRPPRESEAGEFQLGGTNERGRPVLQFCREVLALIEEVNQQLEKAL